MIYGFEQEKKKDERHIFPINRGTGWAPFQLISKSAHHAAKSSASGACGKSELELFSVPPTQTAIYSSQWVDYRSITTLSDSGLITDSGPFRNPICKWLPKLWNQREATWPRLVALMELWRGWCRCRTRQFVAPFSLQSSRCESKWAFSHPVHEHVSVLSLFGNCSAMVLQLRSLTWLLPCGIKTRPNTWRITSWTRSYSQYYLPSGPYWWWVNVGPGNNFVPSGNKSAHETM